MSGPIARLKPGSSAVQTRGTVAAAAPARPGFDRSSGSWCEPSAPSNTVCQGGLENRLPRGSTGARGSPRREVAEWRRTSGLGMVTELGSDGGGTAGDPRVASD